MKNSDLTIVEAERTAGAAVTPWTHHHLVRDSQATLVSLGACQPVGGEAHWVASASARVSVIIPVYNSEAILPELVERLDQALTPLCRDYEIVLVNDGSWDGSWERIQDLATRQPRLRGINLMRNFGQHNALLCGVRAARFEILVTMDDDLQNPPEELHKLLAKLDEGYDVVYGSTDSGGQGLWRELASHVTRFVLRRAMNAKAANQVSSFRAIRAEILKAFDHYQSPLVSLDVLLAWATSCIGAESVRQDPRRSGASNYTFGKLVMHAINMMTGFSTWPLRIASLVGFGFTAVGVLLLVLVLGRYLVNGGTVPGFPFLGSAIAIFSGAQLFALGIMGEYLARLYYRMMERPPYVVRGETKLKT